MTDDPRVTPATVTSLGVETLFRGKVFDLERRRVRLPSGLEQSIEVVAHPGAVAVAALLDGGELLLVRQYRAAACGYLLEIPAGRIEGGEDPLAAARRELEEETGYRAREWRPLARFFAAPGFCSEVLQVYAARGLEAVRGERLQPDPEEEIDVIRMPLARVLTEAAADAKTLIAALLLSRPE